MVSMGVSDKCSNFSETLSEIDYDAISENSLLFIAFHPVVSKIMKQGYL